MAFARIIGSVALAAGLFLRPAAAFGAAPGGGLPGIIDEDAARALALLSSPAAERRAEGLQRLSSLKHWPAEEAVLRLLEDPAPAVKREAVLALGRLGGARSVPALAQLLDDRVWETRQNAWLALQQMTAQAFDARSSSAWEQWWENGSYASRETALFAGLRTTPPPSASVRRGLLRALRHLATPAAESNLLAFIATPRTPPLDLEEWNLIAETLERAGGAPSVPALARMPGEAAAWALGRIGGPAAEDALLRRPKTLAVWLALDRLGSARCGANIPELVGGMGLVTFRAQPDDLMNAEAQPVQRVAARLIQRSGRDVALVEHVIRELELTSNPPVTDPAAAPLPPEWAPMLQAMRPELKPGFVRGDGLTTSQPLTALYFTATNPALAPRLLPLLRHPAFVARVYVAMTLAKLQAREALPALVTMVREGYPFSDSTALASGKHSDQSQTVRWRGFLCMALGRLGGDQARLALEALAADPAQPRDIRYSSVIGLGFIASPLSVPVLRRVAEGDLIWLVRDEARRTVQDITVLSQESKP